MNGTPGRGSGCGRVTDTTRRVSGVWWRLSRRIRRGEGEGFEKVRVRASCLDFETWGLWVERESVVGTGEN